MDTMTDYRLFHYFILAIFGGGGVLVRFFFTLLIPKISQINIPILIVNILGSFLLGYFYHHLQGEGKQYWYLWASVGFCGGLTTFSSFTLDVILLLQQHQTWIAIGYIVLSLVLSLLAVWAGMTI